MCLKLIHLACFVFCVSLVLTGAVEAGLVGWWKLDEGSGTVAYDTSGFGRHGTITKPIWEVGRFGSALKFEGASYVDIPPESWSTIQRQATMAFWAYGDPASQPQANFIFGAFQDPPNNESRVMSAHVPWSNGNVYFDTGGTTAGGYDRIFKAATPAEYEGSWQHWAFVKNADTGEQMIYLNGAVWHSGTGMTRTMTGVTKFTVGTKPSLAEGWYYGMIDDVRLYDHPLSRDEILAVLEGAGAGYPYALGPNPPDGGLHADTWVTLSWRAGDFAVSHDVYLGENFDDVNNGTGGTFRGNQTGTFYVAGFPGFAYPNGLVPGTTYYWRIDEVNAADPNSPWKGKIWRFTVPPKKAYNPSPADGAKFIDATATTLSWTAGFGAKLHTVYFGDNFDTVSNAAGGLPQAPTSYSPAGPLKQDTTYYWRVDEFDAAATHKGDIWSFTTAKAGGGVKGQYHRGMNFESLVLTRTDPQINFTWGANAPDPAVGTDSFSVRWTGEVEPAFTETYTFYPRADDGVRLWVDGQQLVNAWIDQGATEYAGQIDLVAGKSYSIQMEMYENGGDAVAELRWSSPRTPKQLVPQAALSPPVKASSPNPANGATDAKMTQILTWSPGDFAASHDVYFGMDADGVKNATKASPEYKGSKPLGNESYDPGKLAWDTTYYWRIDEVNNARPDSPWKGTVWTFKTGDFLVVDNFEDYDAGANQIWYSWHDGLGYGAPGAPPYFAGNGTGAAVGDENTASYTEETIVHGGRQSMPLNYNNNKQGLAKYSEAELTLTSPRDWTEEGVGELSLWFRGRPGSVGSFVESPVGTFTMAASGVDVWGNADQFHYAFKTLTGAGSIVAKVQSVQNTNAWAKAGVMIRETLDAGSKHAFVAVTPGNGVASQGRDFTDGVSFNTNQTGLTAPYWVKLERDAAANFTASHSANGTTWQPVQNATPMNIPMSTTVYIGLALTSHDAALTCQAVFTNVTIAGTVGPQWAHQDIGIASNAAEPLYVAVSNSAGSPAIMVHPDAGAVQIATWTEWVIPLQSLADKGINLKNVDRIAVGLGTRGNMTTPGGAGKMYFDDIRLYQPRVVP
jgi:hypothetical protein